MQSGYQPAGCESFFLRETTIAISINTLHSFMMNISIRSFIGNGVSGPFELPTLLTLSKRYVYFIDTPVYHRMQTDQLLS